MRDRHRNPFCRNDGRKSAILPSALAKKQTRQKRRKECLQQFTKNVGIIAETQKILAATELQSIKKLVLNDVNPELLKISSCGACNAETSQKTAKLVAASDGKREQKTK
jgi:hypothetical protein